MNILGKFLLLALLAIVCYASDPIVNTEYGAIEGFQHKLSNGNTADVFLGIRYARPPDGIFRFSKPHLVEPWHGLVHQAKQFGAACFAYLPKALYGDSYSEDCLFLNIVAPSNRKSDEALPVLMFIHGGAFEVGSSIENGYEEVAENFASRGIIYVSIQYRLGPLGFLTTGDEVLPGNLGLWDQTMALQFLHQVLPSFGGDVDRITLAGHSAGAASTSALLFSPHSYHLFDQAIEMSASVFAEWATSENVVAESKSVIEAAGCNKDASKEVVECLKELSVDEILEAVGKTGQARFHANFLRFQPRIDKDFFPYDLEKMLQKAPKKKTLQGVTDLESGMFAYMNFSVSSTLALSDEQMDNYIAQDLTKYIVEGVTPEPEFGRKMGPFLHNMLEFYEDRDADPNDKYFFLRRYIELMSDLQFNIPVYQEIELKRLNGWETYYYVIDQELEKTNKKRVPGAIHAVELPLLMNFFGVEKTLTEADQPFKNAMVDAFSNFVKTGKPTLSGVDWLQVSSEHPSRNLRFNRNPHMSESFRPEANEFWLKTLPKRIGVETVKHRLPAIKIYTEHTEL